MEFGKIQNIENVNWDLHPDPEVTTRFLKTLKPVDHPYYYLGTPAWRHKEWVGVIYPAKTKEAEYLRYYSRNYQCVEFNTSHYRIPTEEQTKKWRALVPENFLFCPKVFKDISHSVNGMSDVPLLKRWLNFLDDLGTNCGPSFLQLPPNFGYQDKLHLFHFLKMWPEEFELAIEFRHPSWFENGQILPALTEYLQGRNIGLVITDVAGRRDVLHSSVSADFTMVRFIGNDLHPSDEERVQMWVNKLKHWTDSGLKNVFFFIHEPEDLHAPQMTQIALKYFQKAGIKLPALKFYDSNEGKDQQSLQLN